MARLFLDACALAKRYLREPGSDTMHAIVGAPEFRGRLFVAEHIEGEMLSLLNANFRRGLLSARALRVARGEFYTHFPTIFAVVPARPEIAENARNILNLHARHAVTHPDALHLAAAKYVAINLPAADLLLATSDGPMKAIAKRLRIPLFDPETDSIESLG